MSRLYIDTNVIIDAVEDRKNKFGKNIGNPASDLFLQAVSCKYRLIISTWTIKELADLRKIDSVKMFFRVTKAKTDEATYSPEEISKPKQRSEEHPDDALHVIIAERENADYIVTRNTDHFHSIMTSIPIKKPENLL